MPIAPNPVYNAQMARIPQNKPSRRTIDVRSLSYGLSGPEQPYPVYQFSHGRARWEYPGHNPFLHVPPFY